jgi:hypothetical protein
VGLFEENGGRKGEERRMIVNNMEIYLICVGRRQNEMH